MIFTPLKCVTFATTSKELRLKGISDIASANAFLADGEYLKKHNAKFAVSPPKPGSVLRPLHRESM